MEKNFILKKSNLNDIAGTLGSHKSRLAYPMDSYCEGKPEDSIIS